MHEFVLPYYYILHNIKYQNKCDQTSSCHGNDFAFGNLCSFCSASTHVCTHLCLERLSQDWLAVSSLMLSEALMNVGQLIIRLHQLTIANRQCRKRTVGLKKSGWRVEKCNNFSRCSSQCLDSVAGETVHRNGYRTCCHGDSSDLFLSLIISLV